MYLHECIFIYHYLSYLYYFFNIQIATALLKKTRCTCESKFEAKSSQVLRHALALGAKLWCAELWHERLVAAGDESKKA